MKILLKENFKYLFLTIFVLISWYSLHFIYPHIIESILNNIKWFLIFILSMCSLYFIKLIIEKDFKGIKNFLLTLFVIFLFIYFIPILSYEKKELPNGTLMSMNRFTKQITVKPSGSNLYYIADLSGSVSYRNCETNKEIGYIPPNFNDNLYKTCLSVLKDY